MASINFGGLASGLDTSSIIEALMEAERKPLTRLENDKKFLTTRLKAFSDFNTKLETLDTAFKNFNSVDKFRSYSTKAASDEFFTVKSNSTAKAGNFNIEVMNLAQVQKTASVGYASPTSTTFSAGTIYINEAAISVDAGDTMTTLVDKINTANTGEAATGVAAALINDGTPEGYRIILTGKDASTEFTAYADGVSADKLDLTKQDLTFSNTQTAQQAIVKVDGLTIVSNNNTLKNAIPGVDLTLFKKNVVGEATQLEVNVDTDGVKAKINTFVSAYNDIIKFISNQKDSSWQSDSGLLSTKRRLQNMLVEGVGGTGSLQHLVDIGITSNKSDGTISLNSSKLDNIIANDFQGLEDFLLGKDGITGINDKFINYLEGITDSTNGLYSTKKKSSDSSIKGIDRNIETMNRRLEQREKSMRAQFEALELLMSSMNATSNYLTQQISSMNGG